MVVRRRSKRADEEASSNERMQKLGTFNLALNPESLTSDISPNPKRLKALPLSASPRRSSRLTSVDPVDYSSSNFWTKSIHDADKGIPGEKASNEQKIKESNDRIKNLGISPNPKRLKALLLSTSPRRSSRLKSVNPVDYSSNNFWTKSIYDPEKGEPCHRCSKLENEKAMVVWRQNEREYGKGSNYEELREQRIKENNERMKELGIVNLALKLQSSNPKTSPNPKRLKALPLSTTPRRSSRLKNVDQVDYSSKNFTKPEYDPEKGQMLHHSREFKTEKIMVVPRQGIIADEKGSKYEEIREQRIKENRERMKKLGIFDLALKLNSPTPKTSPNPKRLKLLPLSTSLRRSPRLKSVKPVTYSSKRYIKSGPLCHHCRRTDLRVHTHCSNCKSLQGQFCGMCLKLRYGEDLLEAVGNARWVCPVCREICSCHFCRKKKGLAPLGRIYRKVEELGFKSVAHYLSVTRLDEPDEFTGSRNLLC